MYKDQLYSAMDKIIASEEFKKKVKYAVAASTGMKKITINRRLLPAFAFIIAIIVLGVYYLPSLHLNQEDQNISDNLSDQNSQNMNNNSKEFEITGQMEGEACYISVAYLYGYAYSPSEWLTYSRNFYDEKQFFETGDKLGEVTLDLRGITYTGVPPDFSSTYDIGTEIYELKDVKKERAVLVRTDYMETVFYRERKSISEVNDPIDLTLSEVFQMMTDQDVVTAVELRSEEDGSWMRTSEDKDLIALINKELPQQPLLTRKELGEKGEGYRVPVNLMFGDGAALHMQFYPEQRFASVFGGYIAITEELAGKIIQLNMEGERYDKVTEILPVNLNNSSYLYIKDQVDEKEILCENPAWSGGALYETLKYYRVTETSQSNAKRLVMTMNAGSSETDHSEINFYEDETKNIIIYTNGEYYETIKGHMSYEDLVAFLINYTEIGGTD